MKTNITEDTLKRAWIAALARVQADANLIPLVTLANRRALVVAMDSKVAPRGAFFNVEFRKAGTSCTLTFHASEEDDYESRIINDAGDEYRLMYMTFSVNWPCHGSVDPATALGRLSLYEDVSRFAAGLHAEFANQTYYHMIATKAEREEAERKAAERRAQVTVVDIMQKHRSDLRLGRNRQFKSTDIDAKHVPSGKYEHEFADGKVYTLEVYRHPYEDNATFVLFRTK